MVFQLKNIDAHQYSLEYWKIIKCSLPQIYLAGYELCLLYSSKDIFSVVLVSLIFTNTFSQPTQIIHTRVTLFSFVLKQCKIVNHANKAGYLLNETNGQQITKAEIWKRELSKTSETAKRKRQIHNTKLKLYLKLNQRGRIFG